MCDTSPSISHTHTHLLLGFPQQTYCLLPTEYLSMMSIKSEYNDDDDDYEMTLSIHYLNERKGRLQYNSGHNLLQETYVH